MEKLISALKEIALTIRNIEASAETALKKGDKEEYTEKMRKKARLLQYLPDTLAPVTEALPETVREPVEDRLERFSSAAADSLRIGSVFYMYALLYPEDYTEGDPNDLERFIMELCSHEAD